MVLNGYFSQASMLGAAGKTWEAHARDIARSCRSSGHPGHAPRMIRSAIADGTLIAQLVCPSVAACSTATAGGSPTGLDG